MSYVSYKKIAVAITVANNIIVDIEIFKLLVLMPKRKGNVNLRLDLNLFDERSTPLFCER